MPHMMNYCLLKEANERIERHNNAFSLDDMENILQDIANEDLCIWQLSKWKE